MTRLIVVLILGALASTVVVASGGFRDTDVVQSCQAAMYVYRTGFEAYAGSDTEPSIGTATGGCTDAGGSAGPSA